MNKTFRKAEKNFTNNSPYSQVTRKLSKKLITKDKKSKTEKKLKEKNTLSPWVKEEIELQPEHLENENTNSTSLNFRGCNQSCKQGKVHSSQS